MFLFRRSLQKKNEDSERIICHQVEDKDNSRLLGSASNVCDIDCGKDCRNLLLFAGIDDDYVGSVLETFIRGNSYCGDGGLMVKLSPAELVDITKYLQEDDRKRALLSRLLQKAAVKMAFRLQIALDAHDIVIARTKENKPYFKASSGSNIAIGTWNYNVSHHGRLVCIAAHPTHLMGVDLVTLSTRSKVAKTANEFVSIFKDNLTESEMTRILSEEDDSSRYLFFFIFWSLKESYIKAIGLGLGFNLKDIEFTLHLSSSSQPTSLKGCATAIIHGQARRDWRFDFFSVDEDHVMSVARGPLRDAIPSFQQAAWPDVGPILNHEELFQSGSFNLTKEGDHSGAVVDDISSENSRNNASATGNSTIDTEKGISGGDLNLNHHGEKELEVGNEVDAILWADLFGDHLRNERLPPLVKMSLLELLQINSSNDLAVPTKRS